MADKHVKSVAQTTVYSETTSFETMETSESQQIQIGGGRVVSQALIDFNKEKKRLHLSNHARTYDKY